MSGEDVEYFHTQAERCRRLAYATRDNHTRSTLFDMADEYEGKARTLLQPSNRPVIT